MKDSLICKLLQVQQVIQEQQRDSVNLTEQEEEEEEEGKEEEKEQESLQIKTIYQDRKRHFPVTIKETQNGSGYKKE